MSTSEVVLTLLGSGVVAAAVSAVVSTFVAPKAARDTTKLETKKWEAEQRERDPKRRTRREAYERAERLLERETALLEQTLMSGMGATFTAEFTACVTEASVVVSRLNAVAYSTNSVDYRLVRDALDSFKVWGQDPELNRQFECRQRLSEAFKATHRLLASA